MRRARRSRTAALVLAATALAACGGGEDVPDGYTSYDGDSAHVAYPASWQPDEVDDESAEFSAMGPRSEAGYPRLTVARFEDDFPDRPFANYIRTARNSVPANLPDGRVVGEEPYEVDGADEARLLTYRWKQGGTQVLVRQIIAARGDERHGLAVSVPDALTDDIDVEPILDSYRLG